MKGQLVHVFFAAVCVCLLTGADWLQFRGSDVNGLATDRAPTSWTEAAWTAELPGRGVSSPIVIGNRVVLTSSSGYKQDRLHVHCFDTQTGEPSWERQFWATGSTLCHNKTCVAAPTPASDGQRIFAFYSSGDVVCLDLEGNLRWFRALNHDFPNASNSLGMASSLVVVDGALVVQIECDAESFATGLDVETGIARWKIDRPRRANWTSPGILRGKTPDDDRVLLQSSAGLAAVDPATGQTTWSYEDGASTIPSSVVAASIAFVPSHGLTALRPVPQSQSTEILWRESRLGPSVGSPAVLEGRVYTANRAGVLSCADAATGQPVWRLRLKGPFSSSPVAAGGHMYFMNEQGLAQVVKLGDQEGELVFTHEFGETILATPAISRGALYIRSVARLWKIAN
jgi:outer membrane protein assembly factor BamB